MGTPTRSKVAARRPTGGNPSGEPKIRRTDATLNAASAKAPSTLVNVARPRRKGDTTVAPITHHPNFRIG